MKLLFLGGLFPKEIEKEIIVNSKSAVQYAANKFQWAIIDGLITTHSVELEILSAPFIGTYPKEYKKLLFYGNNATYKNIIKYQYVSFNNLWGYRNISRRHSLTKSINRFVEKPGSEKAILIYSPHTPFIEAAVYAKMKDPSIHLCLMVPDLPIYMNLHEKKSILYKVFKKIDIRSFEKNLEFVDSFVLITKHMKDVLHVGERPYVVIEGVVSDTFEGVNQNASQIEDLKSIVYTGTLNIKFGILQLIKAFLLIERQDIVLKICGRGDAEEHIREYCKSDSRIKYLGQLTNDEALRLQKSATILINPRDNSEDYTKYSFPIKTMEYLVSGRPVIAFKLDGIPDEYDEYIFYIKTNSIESIKEKIIEVLNLTDNERNYAGIKAREFISKYKNESVIGSKIMRMIDDCFNHHEENIGE